MYKKFFSSLIMFATVGVMVMPAMLAVAATSTSITPPVMNFSAIAKSATSINLSWDTPQFVDGASFDISYSLSSSGAGTSVSGAPLPISGTHQSFDIANLSSGITYYFSIRIISASGVCSLPKVASATTQQAIVVPVGVVPPVMNLAVNASQTYADISWDTPQYANAAKFEIRYSTAELTDATFASGTEVMNGPNPVSNTSQGVRISGLQPATLYYVGVRMLDASGVSSPTTFASGTTLNSTSGGGSPFIVPPVMNLIASPKSNTEVILTWDTPIYLGNDSFEVVYSTSPITDVTFGNATVVTNPPAAVPGSQQSMTVPSLSQNTLYYFGVRLVNLSNIRSVGAYTSATTKNDGGAVGGGTGSGGTGGGNYDGRIGAFVGVAPLLSSATTTLSNPFITINNGAATTNNQLVNLSITANGCSEMMLANDANFSNGTWEGFATTTKWILESGSGTRTVYGKCRTGALTSGVGSSSIVLTMPEVIASTTQPATAEVTIASGSDVLMSITPNLLTVPNGKEIVVALTANPNGMAYSAHARVSYPKNSLILTKVEYAKGWAPEFGGTANTEDVVNGVMTKSARFPEGFSTPKHFATLTFVSNNAGTGRISIATNNVRVIPGISQTSGVGVLGSDASHSEYLMANMLSIVNEGTYSSIFTLLALLIVVYMAYLGARDKRRHGKAWVIHPSFKTK